MTLTIHLEGNCYVNVQDYKSGDHPTMTNVVVIDSKQLLENTKESIKKIKESGVFQIK